MPNERVTTQRRKEGRNERTKAGENQKEREKEGRKEGRKEGELGRKRERRNSYREREKALDSIRPLWTTSYFGNHGL